jgi:hypothetical protein
VRSGAQNMDHEASVDCRNYELSWA